MAASTDGVVLLFTAKAKPGRERDLKKLFVSIVTGSQHDAGNIVYELHEVEDDPATIILYEQWVSEDLLNAHLESSPLLDLKSRVGDMIEGRFEDGLRKLRKLRPDPAKA